MSWFKNVFADKASPAAKTCPAARPALEELEGRDVPSYLAAEFSGHGVWLYNSAGGAWQQVTAADSSQAAADRNGDVVAEVPGQGVWLLSRGAWQQLTASNASTLAADDAGNVVAEFPGFGVWLYPVGGGWQQLTAADATSLALGTSEEIHYMPYPHPQDGPTFVAAAFAGHGVWRLQVGGGWQQLTAADATTVGINGNGDVVDEFPGSGEWSYSDAGAGGYNPGWIHLTATDAALVGIDSAGNVFGQFPGWGVWYDQVGSWQMLTLSNASSLGVGG